MTDPVRSPAGASETRTMAASPSAAASGPAGPRPAPDHGSDAERPRRRGPAGLAALVAGGKAVWPYTWGRCFRGLDLPFDVLYRLGVSRTVVFGGEHLADLPPRIVFAGTHHSFADVPLIQRALKSTPARHLAGRLVITAAADGVGFAAPHFAAIGVLVFGLYPLERGERRAASLAGLARLLGRGNAVLFFAQGVHADPAAERAGDPSTRFRTGLAHLAADLDATVVPFGIAGTERLMPPDVHTFTGPTIAGIPVSLSRGPLACGFGAPLVPVPGEAPRDFTERVQVASFALTRQAEAAIAR